MLYVTNGNAFLHHFLADLLAHFPNFAYFPYGGNHGEHNTDRTQRTGTIDRTHLRTEYLGAANTNSDTTQAECGIFLFVQMEVIRLLIRTNIQSTDDNTPTLKAFYDFAIGIKKFILRGKFIAAQV